jgi:hypothetical protein
VCLAETALAAAEEDRRIDAELDEVSELPRKAPPASHERARLIALHSLNLRERAEQCRDVLLAEAVAFALIFAIVALAYGVLS